VRIFFPSRIDPTGVDRLTHSLRSHMTPEAVIMGLEGSDPETVETSTIASRYEAILSTHRLTLDGTHAITYSHAKDMLWDMKPLAVHPNGMRFTVFDEEGTMLATNVYASVGGGFVVNEQTQGESSSLLLDENRTDNVLVQSTRTSTIAQSPSLPSTTPASTKRMVLSPKPLQAVFLRRLHPRTRHL
jgi:hypothetical protein